MFLSPQNKYLSNQNYFFNMPDFLNSLNSVKFIYWLRENSIKSLLTVGYLEKQLHIQRKRIQNNKKSEDHIESYKSLSTGSKST